MIQGPRGVSPAKTPAIAALPRRRFLQTVAASAAAVALPRQAWATSAVTPFKISLAEWSLHTAIRAGDLDNLDFPRVAREEFDIEAVEYVSVFFKDKARDATYLTDLDTRCRDHGVQSLLIMVDGEGDLGDPSDDARGKAVENHLRWLEAAKRLGCHSIRVNAKSQGSYAEQLALAADGLGRLGQLAQTFGLNVLVENHGGLSSNGAWLAGVMRRVGMANVGTLPDFGNFRLNGWDEPKEVWYDRYQGVTELMPFAKAVSAKSHEFNDQGLEVRTDYERMMKIVLNAGYRGYVGIEWEGEKPGEYEGVRLTKRLLERIRDELA
ncbi:sugar phosphate isomerase/epimerase family protein [Botrimarina hoheduenensis]|uniref:Xylose isomerase-like TIM barrel n=1 Tax=Botrimarina hoheduenensis TaxID=2528000 RepID=A0A5C5WED6_9BACT|nr:sugar phosphate isomerase/epimerase family protein [Botrimarina hoheduenensis]TWT48415.1 Xylose isomerase-like TIM barrel [Botrimarina hoheduenensis]